MLCYKTFNVSSFTVSKPCVWEGTKTKGQIPVRGAEAKENEKEGEMYVDLRYREFGTDK